MLHSVKHCFVKMSPSETSCFLPLPIDERSLVWVRNTIFQYIVVKCAKSYTNHHKFIQKPAQLVQDGEKKVTFEKKARPNGEKQFLPMPMDERSLVWVQNEIFQCCCKTC